MEQQAGAVNAAIKSRGLATRSFKVGGAFSGLQTQAPRSVGFTEGAFSKDFYTNIFGGNAPNPNSNTISGLGFSEKDALASLKSAFSNNPDLALQTFRATQNQADALQKVRDSKISGGNIGGPLAVLTAGLGFTGLGLGTVVKNPVLKVAVKAGFLGIDALTKAPRPTIENNKSAQPPLLPVLVGSQLPPPETPPQEQPTKKPLVLPGLTQSVK